MNNKVAAFTVSEKSFNTVQLWNIALNSFQMVAGKSYQHYTRNYCETLYRPKLRHTYNTQPLKLFAVYSTSTYAFLYLLLPVRDSYIPTYYENTCEEGGRTLTCDEGYVVKIVDVRCFPYNFTCGEKITRLCNGLRSCSRIDLARQLNYHCKDYPTNQVITSFQCIPESQKPLCRMNLCGSNADDIHCKHGRVFHLQSANCYHGLRDCTPDIYKAIYRTCEGQHTCIVSDILDLLPISACDDIYIEQRNVFMDYICVDERVLTEQCSGKYMTLLPRFGMMRSPGYPKNPGGNSRGCYWVIYPETDQTVDLYVHMAYSVEGRNDCNSRFLQVQYTVCDIRKQKTDIFCDEGRINVKIHSCGTVYVMHWPYPAGEEKGNRFLLSYHVQTPGSSTAAYSPYMFRCERLEPVPDDAKYTLPKEILDETTEESLTTTRKPLPSGDQPMNDTGILGPAVQTAPKAKNKIKKSDPWKMVTLLRVVVVNIFLGLLIIGLIMALVFVCYRYKTFGKRHNQASTPLSNTATTLDDKNSTEMHSLHGQDIQQQGDNYSDSRGNLTHNVHIGTEIMQKETELSVTPSYETTIFHFNRQPEGPDDHLVYDYKTGVTSFLPQASNQENSPESNKPILVNSISCVKVKEPVAAHLDNTESSPKNSKTTPCERDPGNIRDSLYHYKINNDDYAVVLRSPHRDRAYAGNSTYSVVEESVIRNSVEHMTGDDPCKGNNTQRSRSHIHPVPEDDYVSHTTMHLIPQHNCLLHKIPPPPPPVNRNHWGPPL